MTFTASIEPGQYEFRYQSDREDGVFARQAFTVIATAITLKAPESVMAGRPFEVNWSGPDGDGDFITVVPTALAEGEYEDYHYTDQGSPMTLTSGVEPGAYEIRYQSDREDGIFARIPLTVTPMEITLDAPTEVGAGSDFDVTWTGPNGSGDYITVVPVSAADGEYEDYTYTDNGSPLQLTAPDETGDYELRYQSDRAEGVFARIPITVK